jgi:hypothetical protein
MLLGVGGGFGFNGWLELLEIVEMGNQTFLNPLAEYPEIDRSFMLPCSNPEIFPLGGESIHAEIACLAAHIAEYTRRKPLAGRRRRKNCHQLASWCLL